jgi:mycothiol synthase
MEEVVAVALASLDPDAVAEIEALVRRVSGATGHPALGEPKRLELAHQLIRLGGDTEAGTDEGTEKGTDAGSTGLLVHAAGRPGLIGYAQVGHGRRPGEFVTELVLDTGADAKVADALLEAATATATDQGRRDATLRWWVMKATPSDDERAASHGFASERDLVQMRCALPVESHHRDSILPTRAFRPAEDEAPWLLANNREFAGHPEQGQWDLATLLEREHEPWFDADGFRVLEVDGRIAGSCWTKIHRDVDPALGEIYVIGVDPDFQGRGFGRGLTLAGLDWLSGQGLAVGMLYVDAGNSAARALYRTIGFRDDHVDRVYVGRFGPSGRPGGDGTQDRA